jgi:hypothetical protein
MRVEYQKCKELFYCTFLPKGLWGIGDKGFFLDKANPNLGRGN